MAGAIACTLEAHPTWTVAQIRKNLLETASVFATRGAPDSFGRGFGIVNAYQAAQDCNHNDLADWVDLAHSATLDCNENDVLDVCDSPGDWDADSDIDLTDFIDQASCLVGPCSRSCCSTVPGYDDCCALADFDDDGDVDLADIAEFLNTLSRR